MIKYIVLVGKPGSGKTTLSKLLCKNKSFGSRELNIGHFRNKMHRLLPKENRWIVEDLAWEYFYSTINRSLVMNWEPDMVCRVVTLCGVNSREMKTIDILKLSEAIFFYLDCDKQVLLKRIARRKKKQGWFPYEGTFKDLVEIPFHKEFLKIRRKCRCLYTDVLNTKTCLQYILSDLKKENDGK